MTALLSADTVAVLDHVLIYVFVTDFGLLIFDSLFIERFVETEIRHYGSDDLVVKQLASVLHVFSVNVQDMIACDHIALLIYAETSVGIAVISESYVESFVHYEFLQMLDMCGTAVGVDIVTIRFVVHDINVWNRSWC